MPETGFPRRTLLGSSVNKGYIKSRGAKSPDLKVRGPSRTLPLGLLEEVLLL